MLALILFASLHGCSAQQPEATPPTPTPPLSSDPAPQLHEVVPVSEVAARELLDNMFRQAGMRILNDVRVELGDLEVTLDGLDRERGIGYEYIAPQERGLELDAESRAQDMAGMKILILPGNSKDRLRAQAEAFLEAL